MKQLSRKDSSLEEHIEITNKKDLQTRIRNLVKRREQHEARIQKLVGSNPSENVTKESIKPPSGSQFSELLQQLDNNQPIEPSHLHQDPSTFGSHVNLLATVSLKTQYFLAEKVEKRGKGHLVASLKEEMGRCSVNKGFWKEQTHKQCSEVIKQVSDFLMDEQLDTDLFTEVQISDSKSLDYFGTRFVLGKYEQVQLSSEEITKEEHPYISVVEYKDLKIAKIGQLLLKRLLKDTMQSNFPSILHTLFSYPIKTFRIRESLQLIEFNELVRELTKREEEKELKKDGPSLKIYGVEQKSGYSYEIENLDRAKSMKHFAPILHRFHQLILVQMQELPVKHLPLSCLQNHFVIVSMEVHSKGQYFISVGSSQLQKQFRVIIIEGEGKVCQAEILKGGEFVFCKLKPGEYQIYINPIPKQELESKQLEQSFELVAETQQNFTLWIQGNELYSTHGELRFEIRLKQQYNHYTHKIAMLYLRNSNSQKEIEELEQHSPPNELIVRRDIINGLGLVVDSFLFKDWQDITVCYKGSHVLTDTLFQNSQTKVGKGQSLVLYKQAQIQKIVIQRKGAKENLDYSLVQYYH